MSYQAHFPQLSLDGFVIESDITLVYNCIAWAAGRNDRWWWPGSIMTFWPPHIPQDDSLVSFVALFQSFGYQVCSSPDKEVNFEKVAIYASNGKVLHAARQLENGWWTSKLGAEHDIKHTLRGLEGQEYGVVVQILRRQLPVPSTHPLSNSRSLDQDS